MTPALLDREDTHRVCDQMFKRHVMCFANLVGGPRRNMPACASASLTAQLPRRFKSADGSGVKINADQELFDDYFIPTIIALCSKEVPKA